MRAKGSKLERFITATDMLESKLVAIPTEAAWFAELKRELLVFPNGRYDDQVDSIVQFITWAQRRRRKGSLERDPVTRRPTGRLLPW